MRRFLLPALLLLGYLPPAFAAKSVSVAELEQILTADQGKSDSKIASQLAEIELNERLSSARLARWQAAFPGHRTREALLQLADTSAFLNLPASDIDPAPQPDRDTEHLILSRTITYVTRTIRNLPNLLATRATTHFEDSPSQRSFNQTGFTTSSTTVRALRGAAIDSPAANYQPLHETGASSAVVTYRDGQEVEDAAREKKTETVAFGLTTSGEFGPMFGITIADAVRSRVLWGYWEPTADGLLAVLRYEVPEAQSHFLVEFPVPRGLAQLHPAYHGEIAVDPATGEVERLSVVSDLKPPYEKISIATVVEYGPVGFGERTYLCPLRGVALSRIPILPDADSLASTSTPLQTRLNDVTFTNYHLFRADARIVTTAEAERDAGPAPPMAAAANAAQPSTQPALTAAPADPAAPSTEIAAATPAPMSPPAPTPPIPASAPPIPEPPPTPPAPAPTPADDSVPAPVADYPQTVLHTTANLVLVDVTITDRDHPVLGLDRSRFRVFEDGREQSISSFDEHQPPATPAACAKRAQLPPHTYSNIPAAPESAALNVLLLDSLNTPTANQQELRRQMLAWAGKVPPGTPLALFMLSNQLRLVTGFTADIAQLTRGLQSSGAQPSIVTSTENMPAASTAYLAASDSADAATMEYVRSLMRFDTDTKNFNTDQRQRLTLDALQQLSRYLAAVPGRKNLIWFSGSFPVSLGSDPALALALDQHPTKELRDDTVALRQTIALLAAARVAVYPVDARGLMPLVSADAAYVGSPNFASSASPPGAGAKPTSSPDLSSDNAAFGTETGLDQTSMTALADATGGHAYANANDLTKALAQVVENGSSYYTIGYAPSAKDTNGAFRKIDVRLVSEKEKEKDHGKYKLAFRRGYFAGSSNEISATAAGSAGPLAAALLPGAPPATQILFEARVLPATDPEADGLAGGSPNSPSPVKDAQPYAVDLIIGPQTLTFAEQPDGARRSQLLCDVVAYDATAKRLTSTQREVRIDLPADRYARLMADKSGIRIHLALDVPPGSATLRIAVFDPATAQTGSLEIPVALRAINTDAP